MVEASVAKKKAAQKVQRATQAFVYHMVEEDAVKPRGAKRVPKVALCFARRMEAGNAA